MQDPRTTPAERRGISVWVAAVAALVILMFIVYTLFAPDRAYYRFVSVILGVVALLFVTGFFLERNREQLSSLMAASDRVASGPSQWSPEQAVTEAIHSVGGGQPLKSVAGVVELLGIREGRWLANPQIERVSSTMVRIGRRATLTDFPTGVYVYLRRGVPATGGRSTLFVFIFGDSEFTDGIPEGVATTDCTLVRMNGYAIS
jgi:hypothetical protein